MLRHSALVCGCLSSLFVQAQLALAQAITVQEPSLETVGVGTTVSVPDRGPSSRGRRSSILRSKYGPLRTANSTGLSRQGDGLGVEARAQDQAEMDRATRSAADKARQARRDARISESAEHAYETLQGRRQNPDRAAPAPGAIATRIPVVPGATKPEPAEGVATDKLLDRARAAESAGKRELALAFLRVARDKGAVGAQAEIDRLNRTKR